MKPLRDSDNEAAAELAREIFSSLGAIRVRPMFGGGGVYADSLFFALIFGGEIYLRADEALVAKLAPLGSRPFIYAAGKTQRQMQLNYWLLPEEAIDDTELACDFAGESLRLAVAKAKTKRRRA